ncbi:hypothetical protein [Corynebacterium silvaticum]|uniref:Uncharacterized protein n=1 Tax=Corynebacterium silvaticum TaxID=2320431 RepID=A0ACD4PYK2_9CORY|nr:hypothetical protein [Corynebacterium silvaticum]MBH5300444.1 hypothetical protein [Corynebacterium silvaticum]NOM64643.1 hypothetical protein [Corynebacterium silvaticum]NON69872.1 hypothetical protein [Corynebacterium silvaticum]TFA93288.1 hypothetical protein EU802_03780 [Corynebacterium silvaticum]TFA96695.1 hypothetical protein EU799_03880 [Corynebacterium silvaticum]
MAQESSVEAVQRARARRAQQASQQQAQKRRGPPAALPRHGLSRSAARRGPRPTPEGDSPTPGHRARTPCTASIREGQRRGPPPGSPDPRGGRRGGARCQWRWGQPGQMWSCCLPCLLASARKATPTPRAAGRVLGLARGARMRVVSGGHAVQLPGRRLLGAVDLDEGVEQRAAGGRGRGIGHAPTVPRPRRSQTHATSRGQPRDQLVAWPPVQPYPAG